MERGAAARVGAQHHPDITPAGVWPPPKTGAGSELSGLPPASPPSCVPPVPWCRSRVPLTFNPAAGFGAAGASFLRRGPPASTTRCFGTGWWHLPGAGAAPWHGAAARARHRRSRLKAGPPQPGIHAHPPLSLFLYIFLLFLFIFYFISSSHAELSTAARWHQPTVDISDTSTLPDVKGRRASKSHRPGIKTLMHVCDGGGKAKRPPQPEMCHPWQYPSQELFNLMAPTLGCSLASAHKAEGKREKGGGGCVSAGFSPFPPFF